MRRGDPYQHRPPAPPTSGYFYSRSGAPSPSHSHRSFADMPQHRSRRSMEPPPPLDDMTPSYYVEHLATFAVGRQFGLVFPQDGIRKLRRLEKNSAIYAQPLILRLNRQELTVEDENGDLVEKFNMELLDSPTPYVSSDPRDMYNNILLFIVKDDPRDRNSANRVTEMHIFQCNRVAATDVAADIKAYMDKHYNAVKNGRRTTGAPGPMHGHGMPQYPADDASISSDSSELFEKEVNTLNRCFDDIERFVARVQSAAEAQRELEQRAHRYRTAQRSKDKGRLNHPDPSGILAMRAQLPLENEYVDVLRKFKLSFNLLAKLKGHIHEPNAPELLHFLFSPLKHIVESCHWGLGRNIAPQVVAPLLSLEARELLQNCLSSKESDIWMSLGEAWRTPPEDWTSALPQPYRPVFSDGFAPYGYPDQMNHGRNHPAPLHRGESAPPAQYRQPPQRERSIDTAPNTPLVSRSRHPLPARPQRNMSVDNLDLDRLSLERERMDFERAKMVERERRLLGEERRLREERARVEAEKTMLKHETSSLQNGRGEERREERRRPTYEAPPSSQPSPAPARAPVPAARPNLPDLDAQSPRQRAFVDDIVGRGGKLVYATFDRIAQNPKELTVSRGEYLEVLEDSKNWWECRNVHQRVGYVPHTILSVVPSPDSRDIYGQPMRDRDRHLAPVPHQQMNGHHHPPSSGALSPKGRVHSATFSDAGVQANVVQQQTIHSPAPVQSQLVQQQPQFQSPPPQQPQFIQQQPQYIQVPQQQQQQQMFSPAPAIYQQVPQQQQPIYQPIQQQQPQIVHVPMAVSQQPMHNYQAPPTQYGSPAPTQDMLAMLRHQQAQSHTPAPIQRRPEPESNMVPIAKPSLLLTKRTPEEQQVIHELSSTVGQGNILRPSNNIPKLQSNIIINERSPSQDVARWLEDKGFSYRVLELFDGQDGSALFSLNKSHLIQACGRDEGSRLYSQILVQKNRSNYQTKTNAELKAILNMRKTHVEVTNTAPDEEPGLAVIAQ